MGIDFNNNNYIPSNNFILKAKQERNKFSGEAEGVKKHRQQQQQQQRRRRPLSISNVKFLKSIGYKVRRYGSYSKHW